MPDGPGGLRDTEKVCRFLSPEVRLTLRFSREGVSSFCAPSSAARA
jgi:hypothetical protein